MSRIPCRWRIAIAAAIICVVLCIVWPSFRSAVLLLFAVIPNACCCSSDVSSASSGGSSGSSGSPGGGYCHDACSESPASTISAFVNYTAEDGTVGDFCPPQGVPCDLARGQTFVLGLMVGPPARSAVNTGSSAGSCTSEANSLACAQEWSYDDGGINYCNDATFGFPITGRVSVHVFVVKLPDGTLRLGGVLKLSLVTFTTTASLEISLISNSLGTSPLLCASFSAVTLNEVCRFTDSGLNCGIGPVTMTINP